MKSVPWDSKKHVSERLREVTELLSVQQWITKNPYTRLELNRVTCFKGKCDAYNRNWTHATYFQGKHAASTSALGLHDFSTGSPIWRGSWMRINPFNLMCMH